MPAGTPTAAAASSGNGQTTPARAPEYKPQVSSPPQARLLSQTETMQTEDTIVQAPATRSSIVEDDYWVADMPAAKCEVVDTRRLDRYPLERMFTLDHKTRLLFLVRVLDDAKMFNSKGSHVFAAE